MAKIEGPLFGEKAGGSIAGLLTFRTRKEKAETMKQTKSTKDASPQQEAKRADFAQAHEQWMLLPKQEVHIKKRYYWRRIPGWPDYWNMWQTPAAPTDLIASLVSETNAKLNWTNNATNHSQSEIQKKIESGGSWALLVNVGKETVTYTDTGTTRGTTYYYRIRAFNDLKFSAWSNETSLLIPALQPPAAPTSLIATANGQTQIDLGWTDNSTNEDGFKIDRKTGIGGAWGPLATKGPETTYHFDTTCQPGTTYYYRVYAYNEAGNSGYSNEANATTQAGQVPATPTNLSATKMLATVARLTWIDNATNETNYKGERKAGAGGTWTEFVTWPANTTNALATGLTPGTLYYFRVRCLNGNGYSGYSNEASVQM